MFKIEIIGQTALNEMVSAISRLPQTVADAFDALADSKEVELAFGRASERTINRQGYQPYKSKKYEKYKVRKFGAKILVKTGEMQRRLATGKFFKLVPSSSGKRLQLAITDSLAFYHQKGKGGLEERHVIDVDDELRADLNQVLGEEIDKRVRVRFRKG